MPLPLLADTATPDVSDPSFSRVELALLADHGASIERGPFVGSPASHTADLRVEVVNLDADYSHVDWVTKSSQRSFTRALAEQGQHALTIQNDSPQAATVGVGTALRYWYKGRPAVVGVCEPKEETLIALPKDLVTQWQGRLIEAAVCGAMQVYPSGGKGHKPIQENRNLDYSEPAYDDSGWVPVNVIGSVETARFLYYYLSSFVQLFTEGPDDVARGYPDPFAALVTAPGATLLRARPQPHDAGMDIYVRWDVEIAEDGSYDGYLLGDDSIELSIDGVPVGQAGSGFMATGNFTVDLTAGTKVFAMHINNRTDAEIAWALNPGGNFNPGFGAWSLFRSGFTGTQGFVAHSDGTGRCVVSDRVPGMTYGRAFRLLFDEAAARGCVVPALGFTDVVDSAGNPWEYGVVSTRVMNDVFSTLKEQSVANVDFAIRSGAFVLDLWNFGGKGAVKMDAPFTAKTDDHAATMTRLTRKGGGPVTDALLTRTAYGWDEVVRQDSIDTYGRQEAGYSLGASNSPDDVQTIGAGRLDIVGVPRYQYEAIHDTTIDEEWAFNGFDLGDHVPLTPPGEEMSLERVVSIAVSEADDTGNAVETVSLRDVVYYASPIEHFVGLLGQWAKKMIPGTGRGSWPETQPVTSSGMPSRLVRWSPAVPACVTETFDGADADELGPDQTWLTYHGPAPSTPRRRSGVLTVSSPAGSPGTDFYARCEADGPSVDMRTTITIAEVGTLGTDTAAGEFQYHDYSVFARMEPSPGDPSDMTGGTYTGWEFYYGNGDISYSPAGGSAVLQCWVGVGFGSIHFFDEIDFIDPLVDGDQLSIEVTGLGTETHVICRRNADTIFDVSGTSLTDWLTSQSLDPDALPVGRRGGTGMFIRTPIPPSVSGWTIANDDVIAIDDFSVCAAPPS